MREAFRITPMFLAWLIGEHQCHEKEVRSYQAGDGAAADNFRCPVLYTLSPCSDSGAAVADSPSRHSQLPSLTATTWLAFCLEQPRNARRLISPVQRSRNGARETIEVPWLPMLLRANLRCILPSSSRAQPDRASFAHSGNQLNNILFVAFPSSLPHSFCSRTLLPRIISQINSLSSSPSLSPCFHPKEKLLKTL